MPSIIGSSTIVGKTLGFTGPTGPTGPRGPVGPKGLTGITYGPTGSTGLYITDTVSDLVRGSVAFKLSNGATYTFFGFTGPTVSYYNSGGTNASSSVGYRSVLLGVCGGLTFSLRGICGDGTSVIPSLSSDGREVLLAVASPSLTVTYGSTADDFLVYSSASYSVTNTKVKVMGQITEDTSNGFTLSANRDATYFELGLTSGSTPVPAVRVFSDFVDGFLPIPALERGITRGTAIEGISGIDSGGYIVDLDKASVFKISAPVGITAFNRSLSRNSNDSWLFFVEGADVWNLPKNLYFEAGPTGLNQMAFCSGMNLLKIESDYANNRYLGYFVDRCFGSDVPQYGVIGSCCYDGGCKDYVTSDICTSVYGGYHTPLQSCKSACNIGSCCVQGKCVDNVSKELCDKISPGSWSPATCLYPGGTCSGGWYYLQKVNPQDPVYSTNIGVPAQQRQEVLSFKVWTSDPDVILEAPLTYTDSSTGVFIANFSFYGGLSFGYDTSGTVINRTIKNGAYALGVTLYFDNSNDSIFPDWDYDAQPSVEYPIVLKKSTGEVMAGITYNIKPKFAERCAGDVNSRRIKTAFTVTRHCDDCYTIVNGAAAHYPVQTQTGTFDFCTNAENKQIGSLCMTVDDVVDVNDCTITEANNETDPVTGDPIDATACKHVEYGLQGSMTDPCPSGDCGVAVVRTFGKSGILYTCKGHLEAQTDGISGPYFYTVKFEPDDATVKNQLILAGITSPADITSIMDDIKTTIYTTKNPTNSARVVFTNENKNSSVVLNSSLETPCCTFAEYNKPSGGVLTSSTPTQKIYEIPADWTDSDPTNIEIKYLVIPGGACGFSQSTSGGGNGGTGKVAIEICNSYNGQSIETQALLVRCRFIKQNGVITPKLDPTNPGCIVAAITPLYFDYACAHSSYNALPNGTRVPCPSSDISDGGCYYAFSGVQIAEVIKGKDTAPATDNIILIETGFGSFEQRGGCYYHSLGNEIQSSKKSDPEFTFKNTAELVLAGFQIKQYFWKTTYCACTSKTAPEICLAGDCTIPYEKCYAFSLARDYNHIATGCEESSQAANSLLFLEPGTSGPYLQITPKLYSVSGDAVTLTTDKLYYTIGYTNDPTPSTISENIKTTISGTGITFEDKPENTLFFYWTNGTDVNFYNRTTPVNIIEKYTSGSTAAPEMLSYIRVRQDDSDPFVFYVNTGVAPATVAIIRGQGWEVESFEMNIFTYKNGAPFIETAYNDIISSNGYVYNEFGPYNWNDYTNDAVYNKDGYVTIGVTNIIVISKNGEYRLVESTRKMLAKKPNTEDTFTGGTSSLVSKLLTTEDGQEQCVLINCAEFGDCSLLPDC